ncbi:hypothetical protein HJC23_013812 [Cyclotella cryptica]|uniref:Potassium channel tetramerisation-type BTB domain-containing protein n=1 Tax=Cyclotella cryptica TaxID=29204 RepID=A0ABD3NR55_9STRA
MLTLPRSFETVTFDVGGKICKVSREIIDENPYSMLAHLTDLEWSPIFIDRDGDVFAQVLNYLRYGRITLPITIPKDMFLQELEFYGIVPGEGTISEDTSTMMKIESFRAKLEEKGSEQADNESSNFKETGIKGAGRAGWDLLKQLDRKLAELDEAFVQLLMRWSSPL